MTTDQQPITSAAPADSIALACTQLSDSLGPITPELALVDPDLAAAARALLPERGLGPPIRPLDKPDFGGAGSELPTPSAPPVLSSATAASGLVLDHGAVGPRRTTDVHRRVFNSAAACVTAAICIGLLLAGDGPHLASATRSEAGRMDGAADLPPPLAPQATQEIGSAAALSPPKPPQAIRRSRATERAQPPPEESGKDAQRRPGAVENRPSSSPRTFVWASVDDAAGYDVSFYRGGLLILHARTTRPLFVVPSSWRKGVTVMRLGPGSYTWVVWALQRHGGRLVRATAVVRANLTVPG